jgi:hypothetical protein
MIFFIIGTVAGVFIALVVWNTNMGMVLVVDADGLYGLQLEYEDGTPMTDHDWGIFTSGQTKSQNATLNYTGTVTGNVTWNSTIPAGWSISIWVYPNPGVPDGMNWLANEMGTVPTGVAFVIRIDLTEVSATEGVPEVFVLSWYSGPP